MPSGPGEAAKCEHTRLQKGPYRRPPRAEEEARHPDDGTVDHRGMCWGYFTATLSVPMTTHSTPFVRMQMLLTASADGCIVQPRTPFSTVNPAKGFVDVYSEIDATMCWNTRSSCDPGESADVQLTETAELVALYAGAQFNAARESDHLPEFASTFTVVLDNLYALQGCS